MANALTIIRDDIYSTRERFDKMAGGTLNFEREAGFAIQVVTGSDYAMRIAMESPPGTSLLWRRLKSTSHG